MFDNNEILAQNDFNENSFVREKVSFIYLFFNSRRKWLILSWADNF
jgi:hypothetical protein